MLPSGQLRSLKHLLNPASQIASDCESGNGASVEQSIQGLNNHTPLTGSTSSISQPNGSSTRTTVRSSDRTPLGHPRLPRRPGNSPRTQLSLTHREPGRSQSPVRLGLTGGSSSKNSQRVVRSPTPPTSPGSDDFERELEEADSLPLPTELPQGGQKLPTELPQGGQKSRGHRPSELSEAVFTRPLSESNAATLKKLLTYAELDERDSKYAKGHSEIHGTDNRYIASVVFQTRILTDMTTLLEKLDSLENKVEELTHSIETPNLSNQSTSQLKTNAPPGNVSTPWSVSSELHEAISNIAKKSITLPILEAYTSLTYNRKRLTHSLFNTIRKSLVDRGPEFVKDHLPPKIREVHDATGTKHYHSEIRKACKRAREKMHLVLLTGIHNQGVGEETKVPVLSIKALVFEIAETFGIAGQKCDINSVWANTDEPTRVRIAYLRREAARIVQEGGKGSSSIWAAVDHQLGILRANEDPDFTAAFLKVMYDDDCEMFDGKNLYKDVKEVINFKLPTEKEIKELMRKTPAQNASTS